MAKPLEGVRIIDLTAYLSGPFATMNLAALGAEVIKIERPGIGDPCRWNPPFAGPHEISMERKDETDISLLYLSMQDACFSLATDGAMDINLSWGLPTRAETAKRCTPGCWGCPRRN